MAVYQYGALNLTALIVPDLYVVIVPPQQLSLNGVPSDIVGVVGTAEWGPVDAPVVIGSSGDYAAAFGALQNRTCDMGTYVAIMVQQGAQNFRCVRVTDGTDVATSAEFLSAITLTAKYTGSLGNKLQATFGPGSKASTGRLTVSLPGATPEIFDNISQGVTGITSTPGSGYTSVPALAIDPPSAGGTQATASATLKVVSAAEAAGGTGYAVNDTVTLSNGVVLEVTAVTTGAISGVSVQNGGSLTSGAVPANPVAQVSTSGSGTGATFTLTWGLGPVSNLVGGTLYSAAPNVTLTGGGGTGGAYTAVLGIWQNLANAVNNGNGAIRGPSQLVTAAAVSGASEAIPSSTTTYPFAVQSGVTNVVAGTDGASAVTDVQLLGQDTGIRTGMYVLEGQGCEIMALCDLSEYASFVTFGAFAQAQGAYAIVADSAGSVLSATGISTAATNKSTAGLDTYSVKIMFGDWIYWADPVNGVTRLVSPVPFAAGRLANLSPEQSSLNKPIYGVVGTQKSGMSGTANTYAAGDLGALTTAGFDVISNPQPGGAYWGCRIGHNSSSNPAVNGDNYTRLTNYLAATLDAGMGKYVSKPINTDLFQSIRGTLMSFLGNMLTKKLLGTTDPSQVPFEVQCNLTNNPDSQTSLGCVTANVNVKYQGINEKFVVNLQGGTTVTTGTTTSVTASGPYA